MVDTVDSATTAFIGLQAIDRGNALLRRGAGLTDTLRPLAGSAATDVPIVETLRSDLAGLTASRQSAARSEAVVGVGLAAGRQVQDGLLELRGLAVRARDASLSTEQRADVADEFAQRREELDGLVAGASFDGSNLVAAGAPDLALVDRVGRPVEGRAQDLSPSGLGIAGLSVATSSGAATAVDALDGAVRTAAGRVGTLADTAATLAGDGGTGEQLLRAVDPAIAGQVASGIDSAAAAGIAEEVRRTLGVNRLNIANARSESLLALLRG